MTDMARATAILLKRVLFLMKKRSCILPQIVLNGRNAITSSALLYALLMPCNSSRSFRISSVFNSDLSENAG
jgi:hypothetical protein